MTPTEPYFTFPNNHSAHKSRYNETCAGFIHPDVQFNGPIKVGIGVVIEENVIFGGNNFIGHRATIRPGCSFGEGAEVRVNAWVANNCWIGKHTVIYNYANVAMGTWIGEYVYFGVKSVTTNANDIVLHRGREFIPNPPRIHPGARIATGCIICPGVRVGVNSLVGAGSLVNKDIPDGEVWFGHPAYHCGYVKEGDVPSAWADQVVEQVMRKGD